MRVGTRVICVDDRKRKETIEELEKDVPNWVKSQKKYTVREYLDNDGIAPAILLEEVSNKPLFFKLLNRIQEPGFAVWRFKEIEEDENEVEDESLIDELLEQNWETVLSEELMVIKQRL